MMPTMPIWYWEALRSIEYWGVLEYWEYLFSIGLEITSGSFAESLIFLEWPWKDHPPKTHLHVTYAKTVITEDYPSKRPIGSAISWKAGVHRRFEQHKVQNSNNTKFRIRTNTSSECSNIRTIQWPLGRSCNAYQNACLLVVCYRGVHRAHHSSLSPARTSSPSQTY